MLRKYLLLFVALLPAGCEQQPAAQAAGSPSAAVLAPQDVVDSILPVEEEIRRFKTQFNGTMPTELQHGAASRMALITAFREALQAQDTVRLRSLALNAAEFIQLYYPHTQYTRPPYRQSPALVWYFIEQNSYKGLTRALARFGGKTLIEGPVDCDQLAVQAQNRLWSCKVHVEPASQSGPIRLFGAILERHGRFKFVSLANDF